MRILHRYLGRAVLQYTLLTLAVLLALFTFVNFLDQLGDLGRGSYDLPAIVRFIALTTPRLIYEILPIATLLGSMLALSVLASDSELLVMRSSGLSLAQIAAAVLRVGGLFVVIAVVLGELVAPLTETRAQRERAEALQKNIKQQTGFGLWVRDGNRYLNLGEILPNLTLRRIRLFEFDADRRLRSLVSATDGRFEGDRWVLNQAEQTLLDGHAQAETRALPSIEWQSRITPQILSIFLTQPEHLSFRQLYRYIDYLRANRQQTDAYELAFWSKIMLPLATLVMMLLAIPFVFTDIRQGNLGRNLFHGILLGLGFFAANRILGYAVLTIDLPPVAGATLPVGGFFLLAMVMFRRVV